MRRKAGVLHSYHCRIEPMHGGIEARCCLPPQRAGGSLCADLRCVLEQSPQPVHSQRNRCEERGSDGRHIHILNGSSPLPQDACHSKIRNTERRANDPTASFDIEDICTFYEGYKASAKDLQIPFEMLLLSPSLTHSYTLDDLCQYGKQHGTCPYYLARESLSLATVIVFNYQVLATGACDAQYVLDPHISNYILPYLNNSNNIILFDEGHNIDNILCENHSITLSLGELEDADRRLTKCPRRWLLPAGCPRRCRPAKTRSGSRWRTPSSRYRNSSPRRTFVTTLLLPDA